MLLHVYVRVCPFVSLMSLRLLDAPLAEGIYLWCACLSSVCLCPSCSWHVERRLYLGRSIPSLPVLTSVMKIHIHRQH